MHAHRVPDVAPHDHEVIAAESLDVRIVQRGQEVPMRGPLTRMIAAAQVGHPAFDEELARLPVGRCDFVAL